MKLLKGKLFKTIAILAVMIVLLVIVNISKETEFLTQGLGWLTVAAGLLSFAASWYSQTYLTKVSDNLSAQNDELNLQAQIASQANNLKLKEAELQAHKALADKLQMLLSQVSASDMEEMTFSIRDAVLKNATEEVLLEIQTKYSTETRIAHLSEQINEAFESSEKRLNHEILMLRGRANLNMATGVFIATFGASLLLLFSLFSRNHGATNFTELMIEMLPRASVVLLIELLAYFFLRLYRSILSDIRYYQNEITNIEMKKATALLALGSESIESILPNFCGTDRNSVMKSDQTTQELERLKIESLAFKNTLNALSGFFAKSVK